MILLKEDEKNIIIDSIVNLIRKYDQTTTYENFTREDLEKLNDQQLIDIALNLNGRANCIKIILSIVKIKKQIQYDALIATDDIELLLLATRIQNENKKRQSYEKNNIKYVFPLDLADEIFSIINSPTLNNNYESDSEMDYESEEYFTKDELTTMYGKGSSYKKLSKLFESKINETN